MGHRVGMQKLSGSTLAYPVKRFSGDVKDQLGLGPGKPLPV